ncbi:Alpha/Beta hydrolase protein [Podospora fimiseda]|uniref:Alpha/Beta hydrolase protein n=1 Tax=Podospora fimiseda TaxID=252190 RepID=A0AAN7BRP8_9PEZI|nr:Alpha/Beta hydrolase protein [Podospora fimiseda]
MPPTRIPTPSDFVSISSTLPHKLHFPSPPESTTAILILFHGLGDSDVNFSAFARNLNLPNVLCITVRGINPVPPAFLGVEDGTPSNHFHWGDDIRLDSSTGELDLDPGYTKAARIIKKELIEGILENKCGWTKRDVLLVGFGQGGSLALGLARVEEEEEYKGGVSIGGGLPRSMMIDSKGKKKNKTRVLVLCGRESEVIDEDMEEFLGEEFEKVKVVRWKRAGDGMPGSMEEVRPMMEFLGERLRGGWL